jgi:transposase
MKIACMSHAIRANYERQWLFPPSLEDLIGADHPARFIREFVDSLDLKAMGFEESETEEGRPHYAEDLLLKVWLYGYFQTIRSSRGLERACRENMGLLWLTGMNEPDHNTLWRFWRDHKKQLRQVFRQGLQIAAKANLVGLVLHAVDGTKIASAASPEKGLHRNSLEKQLTRIDESIEKMIKEVEQGEATEVGEYRLPADLVERQRLREVIQSGLKELDQVERDHFVKTDPDARMMKMRRGFDFGFNAQAVADEQSGLIVGADVFTAEDDHHLLMPMLEQVNDNLDRVAEQNLADGGYGTGSVLTQAQENGYEVLVNIGNPEDKGEFDQSRFSYNQSRDQCICPRGEVLQFESHKRDRSGEPVRVYRCQTYPQCPVRWQCSPNKKGRTVAIHAHYAAWKHQREKQKDPVMRALLKKRSQIIERIFGWIKQNLGFRRWTAFGLDNVKAQWVLLCTTLNLRILYGFWVAERLSFTTT